MENANKNEFGLSFDINIEKTGDFFGVRCERYNIWLKLVKIQKC